MARGVQTRDTRASKRGRGGTAGASSSRGPRAPSPPLADQWIEAVLESGEDARKNMQEYMTKEVQPCKYVEWEHLKEAREYETVIDMLTYEHEYEGDVIVMREWPTLFSLRADVYPVLTWEFLATVKYNLESFNTDRFLRFQLGGESRRLTVFQFCRIFGFYGDQSDDFITDLLAHAQIMPRVYSKPDYEHDFESFCPEIDFVSSTTKSSDMPNPYHRCVQRFVANTINYRKESNEKMNVKDVWLMSRIIRKEIVDIPAMILRQLTDKKFRKGISPLYGGHFVTYIARHFGIDFSTLAHSSMTAFDRRSFNKGEILRVCDDGSLEIMPRGVPPPRAAVGNDDVNPPQGGDVEMQEVPQQVPRQVPQQVPPQHTGGVEQVVRDLLTTHFGALNVRLDGFDTRFDRVDTTVGGLVTSFGELRTEVSGQFTQLRGRVDGLEEDVAALGHTVATIEHNQGWNNYTTDWMRDHQMYPDDPMDYGYQQPSYYSDGRQAAAPVYQYDPTTARPRGRRRQQHQDLPQQPQQ